MCSSVELKMAELSLSEIPGDLVRKAICETIEDQLETKKYGIFVSSASKEGEDNFCGLVYRVSSTTEDGNGSKLNIIVKVTPQNEMRRVQFHSREMFLQEIYMYNEVSACCFS